MILPRGNVLLKPTELELKDLRIKLENLKHYGFNGYMQVDIPGSTFYVFLREGILKSVIQVADKRTTLISELLLVHRLRKTLCRISSFVLSSELVDVLSHWYAFQEKYVNYQVLKKEFRKVLASFDSDKITGMIEIQIPEENSSVYFLLNQGHIVTDSFLDFHGQIVTGVEKVSELIKILSAQGGLISSYGEKHDLIDRKGKQMLEELERYKELVTTVESSFLPFGSSNAVKVDEDLLREWSPSGNIQKIEIFTNQGQMAVFKVASKKGLGNRISLASSLQKKLGLEKDEPVLVRPG